MRKNLAEYIKYVEGININEKVKDEVLNEILINIGFWQHERLVHLIVSFFTGIAMVLVFIGSLAIDNFALFLLFMILLLLFIPYIFHYYFLENGVQKLYDLYNNLGNKKHN